MNAPAEYKRKLKIRFIIYVSILLITFLSSSTFNGAMFKLLAITILTVIGEAYMLYKN